MGPLLELLVGNVNIGTPPKSFTVIMDTGSSDLVVPGAECQDGACLSHERYNPELSVSAMTGAGPQSYTFGQAGTISANQFRDTVCLGGAATCVTMAVNSASSMSDRPFAALPYSGILGLGFPADPAAGTSILASWEQHKSLRKNRFAIWIKNESDDEESKISIGKLDHTKLASKVYWVPILPIQPRQWAVPVSNVVLGMPVGTCKPDAPCKAVIDSSTTLIVGAKSIIDGIKAALTVTDEELRSCNDEFIDKLKPIGFVIDGYKFNLEKEDYLEKREGLCLYRFGTLETSEKIFYFGTPWLRKFYTVFDRDSLRLGFAVSSHAFTEERLIKNAIAQYEKPK